MRGGASCELSNFPACFVVIGEHIPVREHIFCHHISTGDYSNSLSLSLVWIHRYEGVCALASKVLRLDPWSSRKHEMTADGGQGAQGMETAGTVATAGASGGGGEEEGGGGEMCLS